MADTFDPERTRILALDQAPDLSQILGDGKQETALRLLAAQRLGMLGTAGKEVLLAAYEATAEDPPGRVAALKALVGSFLTDAQPILLRALQDPWPRVRRSARLLLKNHSEGLDLRFRFLAYLPEHLRANEAVLQGDWFRAPHADQATVVEAIGQARFTPALPQLVDALHQQGQVPPIPLPRNKAWYGNAQIRRALGGAVAAFGNEAIPHIAAVLDNTTLDRYSLFSALARINTSESWKALEPFQNTHAVKRLIAARKDNKRTPQHSSPAQPPRLQAQVLLSTATFTDSKYNLFWGNRKQVRAAIDHLQRETREEAPILLSALAEDTTSTRCQRQWAHNGMEVWRRYNGSGKR